ncbi:hypothetical protein [Paracoccus sp. (in: a-proteobacteria)]|uniref:hypothetical protein n=1 Tax=Paracoccus sp. TaxID=267 RepID=UPI00289CF2C9|nr:hypothetical protein [Paracoccus sp. (in: a-proteobacteria)]
MAEDRKSLSTRAVDAVENMMRSDLAQNRHVAAAATKAAALEQREIVEEARAARINTALSEMADAVIAGERPRFRTDEQATAFLQDFETRYGAGAMERLRAGDSTDLARDEADPSRVAIKSAALRMVAETHAVLRGQAHEQDRTQSQTLDRESGPELDL